MEIEKLEFGEAVQILAKDAGIELKTDIHKERDKNAVDVYAMYKHAAEWYHESLYKEENKHALEYLLAR
jgi:DNA primase